jgi:hypothetical protein
MYFIPKGDRFAFVACFLFLFVSQLTERSKANQCTGLKNPPRRPWPPPRSSRPPHTLRWALPLRRRPHFQCRPPGLPPPRRSCPLGWPLPHRVPGWPSRTPKWQRPGHRVFEPSATERANGGAPVVERGHGSTSMAGLHATGNATVACGTWPWRRAAGLPQLAENVGTHLCNYCSQLCVTLFFPHSEHA